jgi:hypothetical protein
LIGLQSARTFCSAFTSPAFFSVSMTADNFISPEGNITLCRVLNSDKNRHVKADGLVGAARRPSAKGRQISWAQAYEKRMHIFNLEVILAALIALALLIGCSFTAWEAFQNSVPGAS